MLGNIQNAITSLVNSIKYINRTNPTLNSNSNLNLIITNNLEKIVESAINKAFALKTPFRIIQASITAKGILITVLFRPTTLSIPLRIYRKIIIKEDSITKNL